MPMFSERDFLKPAGKGFPFLPAPCRRLTAANSSFAWNDARQALAALKISLRSSVLIQNCTLAQRNSDLICLVLSQRYF